MVPTFSIDTRAFKASAGRLMAATNRTAQDVLKQQSRLFVRDAIKFTPPTGKAPITESLNFQRRTGREAIRQDLERLFPGADQLNLKNSRQQELLKRYIETRDFQKANEMFRRMKVKGRIIPKATAALHRASRGANGRPNRQRWFILDVKSRAQLIARTQKKVGMAKSGWATAARRVGLQIPQWITQHAGPGYVIDDLHRRDFPSITMANTVGYIQSAGARLQVIQRAINRRAESMTNQYRAMLGKTFAGYTKGRVTA